MNSETIIGYSKKRKQQLYHPIVRHTGRLSLPLVNKDL